MAVLSNTGIRAGASGAVSDPYRVKRSARFNDDNSAYLNRTTSTAGNKKTWTISLWFKRSSGFGVEQGLFNSGVGGHPSTFLKIDTSDRLEYGDYQSGYLCQIVTNHRFRDPSAWYHLIIVVDTTQAAEANRFKLYINGVQETSFSTANYYSQNDDTDWNNAEAHTLATKSTDEYDGYLADIYFIDGSAKAATDFAETNEDTGQWVPKEYSGSYGTNGFHLAMDPANGGTLHSNEVTGTPYNNDSTNYGGIPMFDGGDHNKYGQAANGGSLTWTPSGGMAFSSTLELRLWRAGTDVITIVHAGGSTDVSSQITNGQWFKWTVTGITSPITSINWASTDGSSNFIALHSIYIDGRRLVDHSTIGYDSSGNNNHWYENNLFGREHTTSNENFKVVTYTGNGGTQTINCGFEPDFVWLKSRSNAYSHSLYDRVRGVTERIQANDGAAEGPVATGLTAFTSTGFTIGSDLGINGNGNTQVAWCWKGGGTGVANDTGTLDSTVSANTTTGFSIVKWNSSSSVSTVGHGLGKVPKMIITKNLDASNTWWTYHEGTGNTHAMRLDTTDTKTDQQSNWNDTSPTSSVFTVGGEWGASNDVIAYCWSEIEGHSKFGSYSGGTNPRVIDCGFTPAFVLIKRTDTANYWMMIDSVRGGTQKVAANSTVAENDLGTLGDAAQNIVVFEPNGFKLTTTNAGTNTSGGTYIYAAFAGNPGGDLDLLADTPAPYDNELNGGGNYCTWNPLNKGSNITTSDGNLKATLGSSGHEMITGTIGMTSGKYYWEVTTDGWNTSNEGPFVGIVDSGHKITDQAGGTHAVVYRASGTLLVNGSETATSQPTFTKGDIIGMALDVGSNTITWYKNGVQIYQYTSLSAAVNTWIPAWKDSDSGGYAVANFGARTFAYTPPSGYKALNTYNLPDPTITKGNTGFDTKLWAGTGSSKSITGLEFNPDLVVIKRRNAAYGHVVSDAVRGFNATPWAKQLYFNSDGAEDDGNVNTISSFNSDGFTIGTDGGVNNNGDSYVGWAWDAGTANVTNDASSTGVGTIDSTYRVNTNTGFSIVSYDGTGSVGSVAHGLGAKPDMIITKKRNGTTNWYVWHSSSASNINTKYVLLNSDAAVNPLAGNIFATVGTTTFGVEGGSGTNNDGEMIAYCWSGVAGYSKFGSYEGNNSTDGSFVYLGFKPALIIVKNVDTSSTNWEMWDSKRPGYNLTNLELRPNQTNAEYASSANCIDILSNGFKLRGNDSQSNSAATFVYAAWAVSPFKYNNAH